MVLFQRVNHWVNKAGIVVAIIGVCAASAYAIWPSTETIKLLPIGITIESSGLKGDALTAEISAANQLLDRATTSFYAPREERKIIASLEGKVGIRAIKIFGASPYQLTVEADQSGTWGALAGLQNVDLSHLPEAWNSLPLGNPAQTSRLRFTLTPIIGAKESSEAPQGEHKPQGLRELEIWGDGTRINSANPATLMDALIKNNEPPAQGQLYTATPEQGIIGAPDKMMDDLTDNTFKVKLPRSPSDFKHLYLAYEVNGISHWAHALRQINGNVAQGGFGLPINENWSMQIEEINPVWLKQGENTITFAPPVGAAGTFTVKNIRLLGELDNGNNFINQASASNGDAQAQLVLDGDTGTGWKPYGTSSEESSPKLAFNFDKPTQVSDLKLFLSNQLKGKFQIEYLLDDEHWLPAANGVIEGKNLVSGWNMLEVPSGGLAKGMRLVFAGGAGSSAEIREIIAGGSSTGDTWPAAISISYPDAGQYFGRIAYLRGYLQPIANESGSAEITVGGKKNSQADGAFGVILSKDDLGLKKQSDRAPWQVEIKATYPDGKRISRTVQLNNYADAIDPKSTQLPSTYRKTAKPGQHQKLELNGAGLELSGNEIDKDVTLGIKTLTPKELSKTNPGMTNVTQGGQGYRFTPTPMKFKSKLQVTIPYDPALLPKGKTEKDIKTYYYDTSSKRWRQLERFTIDKVQHKIISLSDHFTDMINATVTVPEHPDAVSFNPNSIKDIKAADPGAGINLIEPPKPNNMGDARLSYPIEIPPGRLGMQPQLSVNYSSGGGNGWMGLGWDIPQQSISIDTRWGVPRYDANKETETYLLDGEQLTPLAHRSELQPRTREKIFHTRIEGAFRKIQRHGDKPDNYWWEVTDKNGVRYSYGGSISSGKMDGKAVLKDPDAGNIAKWMLKEIRDTHNNTVHYYYDVVTDPDALQPWNQVYLSRITYSGTGDGDGQYEIVFLRESGRLDVAVDARSGFKTLMNQRLASIEVRFNGAVNPLIRRYVFAYDYGAFSKTLLQSITQYGEDGTTKFNAHSFKYYDEARKSKTEYNGFANGESWNIPDDLSGENLLGHGAPSALGGNKGKGRGGSFYVGGGTGWEIFSKENTAGFKIGYSRSESESMVTLADIDGDGLPDKVFKAGSFFYRPNLGGQKGFGEAKKINLPAISRDSTTTTTKGGENYFLVPALFDQSESYTQSDSYLSDVNGDGIVDSVSDGVVYFGYRDGSGNIQYDSDSNLTPVKIGAGNKADTSAIQARNLLVQKEREGTFPLLDTVRRWVAPFDGVVSIDAPVALVQDNSTERARYKTADGVRVAIQFEDTELWSEKIAATDYASHIPQGVSSIRVKRGDRLYFRVQSIYDGAYDRVTWSPVITYVSGSAAYLDENLLSPYRYSAKDEFVTAGRRHPVKAAVKGTVHVTGILEKLGPTTDDVTLLVTKNGAEVSRRTYASVDTTSIDLTQDIQVESQDELEWRVLVDSPIDLSKLKFRKGNGLAAYYTSAFTSSSTNNSGGSPIKVTDAKNRYILQLNPVLDMDIYPANDSQAPRSGYLVAKDGALTVSATLSSAKLKANEKLSAVFTIKRPGILLAKQTIDLVGNDSGKPVSKNLTLSINANKNDKLYFDFTVHKPEDMDKVATHDVTVTTLTQNSTNEASVLNAPVLSNDFFPGSFRGWSVFGYNGNVEMADANGKCPSSNPCIEQSVLKVQNGYSEKDTKVKTRAFSYLTLLEQAAPDVASGEVASQPVPESWGGVDEGAWAGALEMSSSRLGMDNIKMSNPGDYAGAYAVSRLSRSVNTGGGVVGVSKTIGKSESLLDFQDMNGDRFPDVVGVDGVQFTEMTGGIGSALINMGMGTPRSADNDALSLSIMGVASIPGVIAKASGSSNPDGNKSSAGAHSGNLEPSFDGSGGEGKSITQHDLIDINGDGLPDMVFDNGTVSLNLGYRFGKAEPLGYGAINLGKNVNYGISMGFALFKGSIAGGLNLGIGEARTDETYVDINGDGLPDKVYPATGGVLVRFNNGAGFAQDAVFWSGGYGGLAKDKNYELGKGAYFTYGIPLPVLPPAKVVFNFGLTFSDSLGHPELAFRDMDGDGFVDHVTSSVDGELYVASNPIGRTNLLQSVSRPLGATIELEYTRDGNTYDMPQSRWVLSKTRVFDGFKGDGVDTQVTAYAYQGGKYDRNERDFFGYTKVTESQLIAEQPSPVFYRNIEREYLTGNYYTKGLLKRERLLDAANNTPYTETENTYVLRNVESGQDLGQPGDADKLTTATLFPQLVRTDRRFYEGQGIAGKATWVTYAYDAVGNVTQYRDYGDVGNGDDIVADIAYSQCQENHIVGKPLSIVVSGGGQLMRSRQASLDCASGNLTQVRQMLETAQVAVTDLGYYDNGNLMYVEGPANHTGQRHRTEYAYDPQVQTHITGITDASYHLNSLARYHYKYGKVELTTDTNGNATGLNYDQYGRTIAVYGPYEYGTSQATIRFEYYPELDAAHGIIPHAISRHLDRDADGHPKPSGSIDTILYTDGLKRVLQTKKDATLHISPLSGTQDIMTVSGRVIFDALGRTIEQYYPVTEAVGANPPFNYSYDQNAKPTRTRYDILDRTVQTTLPDDTVTRMIYGFGSDANGQTQFMTSVIDANQHKKESLRDVRELITSVREYNGGQIIQTRYTYDPLKQITQVIDDQGNQTQVRYDNLGRRTVIDNPDTGRTETVYDLAGNVLQKITATLKGQGRAVRYDYDYTRLIAINYPTFPANNVTYTYGASGDSWNRAGRIATVVHAAGVEARYYGKLGETVKENYCRKSPHCNKGSDADRPGSKPGDTVMNSPVPASGTHDIEHDNDLAPLYVTQYQYDTFGRLQRLIYPDNETLTYGYDAGGLVNSATGQKGRFTYRYLTRLDYDKFDQRVYLKLGNGVETHYTYRQDNRRLAALQATLPNVTHHPFQKLTYGYDNVGNILTIANQSPSPEHQPGIGEEVGGPVNQTFGYDDLYRLVDASGDYRPDPGHSEHYRLSLAYDSIHNIRDKRQLSEHSELEHGQIKTDIRDDISYTWNYQYQAPQMGSQTGTTHPHAPSDIGPYAYQYDANGNQIERRYRDDDSTRQIVWDEDNRMECVHEYEHQHPSQVIAQQPASCQSTASSTKDSGNSANSNSANNGSHAPEVRFTYNDKGERVYKESHDNVSFYLNPHYTEKSDDAYKHILIGTTRLTTKEVKQEAEYEDDQYYYHPDHLGSSSFVTDTEGKLEEHLEYFPFGETWVEEESSLPIAFRFTAKELDSETNLYYFGARYYDPRTSVWQSADMILGSYLNGEHNGGVFDSAHLALYAYARNNPIIYMDPDGNAEVYSVTGKYVGSFAPKLDKVYVMPEKGTRLTDTNMTMSQFHKVAATVSGEAGKNNLPEMIGIAHVIKNKGTKNGVSTFDSATFHKGNAYWFFGSVNETANNYLANPQKAGKRGENSRAAVIDTILHSVDPVGGRTLFEGNEFLGPNHKKGSNFQEKYVDTDVAHNPLTIGGTTFFSERTAAEAAKWKKEHPKD